MNVLINGIGNIGTTLANVLARYRAELGIDEIYALKNSLNPWNAVDLAHLSAQGVTVCAPQSAHSSGFYDAAAALASADYIFDCTANGMGLKNKAMYAALPRLRGCSAQGSEKHFGTPFMSGVNDAAIAGQRYAQVVSCNTHSLAALVQTFSAMPTRLLGTPAPSDLPKLTSADFVVVRRSEDIGQHERLVSANVVSRHLSPVAGTHHAIDVQDLLATCGDEPPARPPSPMTSSDITTPSQLIHSVRFSLNFAAPLPATPQALVAQSPYLAATHKFDSNVIFEQGRRYGFQGRLFSHAIVVDNNFLSTPHSLQGWAFIPQEGCTILSTVHAYLLQTEHANAEAVMVGLRAQLLRARW